VRRKPKPSRDQLVAALRAAGCSDPEGWADSELEENIPQFARYLLCKAIWEAAIEPWRQEDALDAFPDAKLLLDAGVDRERLRALCGKVAYETMTAVNHALDAEEYLGPADVPEDSPGWLIIETDGKTLEPTGRRAGAIHESILSVDPTGTEGADFRS
jgi:hypothetical protein